MCIFKRFLFYFYIESQIQQLREPIISGTDLVLSADNITYSRGVMLIPTPTVSKKIEKRISIITVLIYCHSIHLFLFVNKWIDI